MMPYDHSRRRIINLQVLRAIAASFVVLDHSLQAMIDRHMVAASRAQLSWFFGWIGVTTFFVISGLMVLRSSIDKFGSMSGAMDFARRRISRVVPIYWAATLIYLLLKADHGTHYQLIEVIESLLFFPYTLAAPGHVVVMRPIVGQGWTLNYEMLFYLLFALCLLFPRKVGVKLLLGFFPIAVAIGFGVRPLIPYLDPVTPWEFWSDPITLFFATGVVIGLVENKYPRCYDVAHPLLGSGALFAAGFILFLVLDIRFPLQIWYQAGFGLVAIGVVTLCTITTTDRFIAKNQYLKIAGDASFSTYLFHPLILGVLGLLSNRIPPSSGNAVVFIILAVLFCNGGGILFYFVIEKPLIRLLHPMTRAQQVPPQAADAVIRT